MLFKHSRFRQHRYDKNGEYLSSNKNIETTMKIYVQVNNLDLLASVPQRPETIRSNSGQNTRIAPHLRLIS